VSQRKPYPSDLSDTRWALIEPTLSAWRKARLDRRPTGQPAQVELRDVFNAILARAKGGRKPQPTASVIDTQSVKTSINVPLPSQGTGATKKIVGRKRGIVTDTLGLILAVTVTAAGLHENALGIRLLDQAKETYPTISKSWVDTGFKNAVVEHGAKLGIDVEVVDRHPGVRGFHVVKRRWVVERSMCATRRPVCIPG
jgi:transposase